MAEHSFTGTYEFTIDDRGRLAVPALYRHRFEAGGQLAEGPDGALELYDLAGWDAMIAQRVPKSTNRRADRQLRRRIMPNAQPVKLDAQGRILISSKMREKLGLQGGVAIAGMGEFLEIWDLETWNRLEEEDDGPSYADLLESLEADAGAVEATS